MADFSFSKQKPHKHGQPNQLLPSGLGDLYRMLLFGCLCKGVCRFDDSTFWTIFFYLMCSTLVTKKQIKHWDKFKDLKKKSDTTAEDSQDRSFQ